MNNTNTTSLQGKISFIAPAKGFGFVISESLQEPIFFHASELKDILFTDIAVGDQVTFMVGTNKRGKMCVDLRKASI